jgi:hypothetical protein
VLEPLERLLLVRSNGKDYFTHLPYSYEAIGFLAWYTFVELLKIKAVENRVKKPTT